MVLDQTGTCVDCGQSFHWSSQHLRQLGHTTTPRRCPACRDSRRGEKRRGRHCEFYSPCIEIDVELIGWERRGSPRQPYLTFIDRGTDWDPPTHGRLDLKTHLPEANVQQGCLVSMRVMRCTSPEGDDYSYVVLGLPERARRPDHALKWVAGSPPTNALWTCEFTRGKEACGTYYVAPHSTSKEGSR